MATLLAPVIAHRVPDLTLLSGNANLVLIALLVSTRLRGGLCWVVVLQHYTYAGYHISRTKVTIYICCAHHETSSMSPNACYMYPELNRLLTYGNKTQTPPGPP
jgi:hypothetical protein